MNCPKCGKETDSTKFCSECGAELSSENVSNEANSTENIVIDQPIPQKKKSKKKIIIIAAIIVLLIAIIAISNSKKDKSSPQITVSVVDNTNTSTETTTEATTETTTEKASSTWFLDHYVDDFQEKVEAEWYIEGDFYGTFSNSATTDSSCLVRVLYDYREQFAFFVYDYGRSQLKNSYSRSEKYTVKIKGANGDVKEIPAHIGSDGDRLWIDDTQALLDAVKLGNISVFLYENDNTIHSYHFTIASDNFSDLLAEVEA